jgi:hypothetical protein
MYCAFQVVSRLLAQNGILPSWIEKQKHVTELTAALQARLAGEWAAAHISINSSSSNDSSSAWQAANAAAVTEAAVYSGAHSSALSELNAAIDGYNLEVPAYHLQRGRYFHLLNHRKCSHYVLVFVSTFQQLCTAACNCTAQSNHWR